MWETCRVDESIALLQQIWKLHAIELTPQRKGGSQAIIVAKRGTLGTC